MVGFFAERVRGVWVAILTIASLGYGWLILQALPWWGRLTAAQGGSELQTTFSYGAEDVARVFAAFDPPLRSAALTFYALDVPNALLFGASVAALMGFGLRLLNRVQTPLRWLIVLPLVSAANDLVENASLTAVLMTSPDQPTPLGTLAGAATTLKLATGFTSLPLMLLLVIAGLARTAWIKMRAR